MLSSQLSNWPMKMENLLWSAQSREAFIKFKTRKCVRSGKKSSKRLRKNWKVLRPKYLALSNLGTTWLRAKWVFSPRKGMLKSTKRKDQRQLQACKAGSSSHWLTLKRRHINNSSNNSPSQRRVTIDRMEVVGVEDMKVQEESRATMASTMPRRSNRSNSSTIRPSSEHIYILKLATSHNPPYEPEETIVNIVRREYVCCI